MKQTLGQHYVLTFDQEWFKLANEDADASVEIVECLPEYKSRVSAAEFGHGFKSPEEKAECIDQIPACFFPVYLHFYLDANFTERKQCVVILKNKKALKQPHRVTVAGTYKGPKDSSCDIDPRLCVQAYITVLSECGALCREDVGVNTHPLALVSTIASTLDLNLRIHTLPQNPTKSKIGLSHIVNNISITPWTPASYDTWRKEKMVAIKRLVNVYGHHTAMVETQMQDFMANAQKITCPLSPSQITFDNSTIKMPIASYCMTSPLETTVNFWLQELKIAAERHVINMNLKLNESPNNMHAFYAHFITMNVNHKCSLGMDMIVQYVQLLEYIGDYVVNTNKKGKMSIEIFGDAIVMHDGDCEDLSLAIIQLFDSFLALKFSNLENIEAPGIKILKELQTLLQFYIPFLCIEGVTANNLMNATKGKATHIEPVIAAPELTGAHGAVKFIPLSLFAQYLNTWNGNHPLSKHVTQEAHRMGSMLNTPPSEILIGEGTGMLEAGIFTDPLAQLRKYVYSCPLMEKVKKPIIPPKRSVSPFYQALLFGFTNRYIHSHGIGLFHFLTKDPHLRWKVPISPLPGRGAVFSDFIRQEPHVYMMPNVLAGEAREYSEELVCLMDSMVATRIPTPILDGFTLHETPVISITNVKALEIIEAREQKSENYANLHPMTDHCFAQIGLTLLRQLVESFALLRQSDASFQKKGELMGSVYIYVLEDYVDATFTDAIKNYFTAANPVCGSVNLHIVREYHDNAFYVYRLQFLLYK